MDKVRVNIFVSHERLFRSFFSDEILSNLMSEFIISIFVAPDIKVPELNLARFRNLEIEVVSLQSSVIAKRTSLLALDFETLCESHRVKSFETRIRHRWNIQAEKEINIRSLIWPLTPRRILIAILYTKIFRNFARKMLCYLADLDLKLLKQLKDHLHIEGLVDTKVLMLSGGAFGGIENVVIKLCRRRGIPTFLVVDNWDNLSSKSIYWNTPDYLAVWGEEMMRDAIEMQGFHKSQISIIGSSRVDLKVNKSESNFNFPRNYACFIGSGWQFSNEVDLVERASKILEEELPTMKLIYRPHPSYLNQEAVDTLISEFVPFKNIILDVGLTSVIRGATWYSLDSLQQLQELLRNAKFIMGAHSTSLVEALYYGKTVIANSYSDLPIFRDGDAWGAYSHMLQIRGNTNVLESKSVDHFLSLLRSFTKEVKELDRGHVDERKYVTNYVPRIIPSFESSYASRLKKFLTQAKI